MRKGFYQMPRGWLDTPALQGEPFDRRSAWVWLVEHAQWHPHEVTVNGTTISVQRGQLSFSTRYLAKAWQWSDGRVRRFLTRLKTDALIDARTDAGQYLITISNYDKIQATPNEGDAGNDAPSDAKATQDRRKYNKGNKENNYAFSGKVIRLNEKDFEVWKERYHGIPDIEAELWNLDSYYSEQGVTKWFHRCQSALNKKHQAALAQKQTAQESEKSEIATERFTPEVMDLRKERLRRQLE